MQFSCGSCQTGYTVPDEKLRGRTVRVHCKRCNNPIIVRDGVVVAQPPAQTPAQPRPPEAGPPPPPAAPQEKAEWFLAIGGVEVGPLTKILVQRRIAAGEVTTRTYAWREGMADWSRLTEVPDLAVLLPSRPPMPAEPSHPLSQPPAVRAVSNVSQQIEIRRGPVRQPSPEEIAGFELGENTRRIFKDAAAAKKKAPRRAPIVGGIALAVLASVAVVVWSAQHAHADHVRSSPAHAKAPELPTADPKAAVSPETAALAQALELDRGVAADAGPPPRPFDASAVPQQVQNIEQQLQSCVSHAIQRDHDLKIGRLVISASVEPEGTIGKTITFSHESVRDSELGRCLQKSVRGMHFGPFDGSPQPIAIPLKVGVEL